jgi:RimJ/RimL family protein N-acetyltransferase
LVGPEDSDALADVFGEIDTEFFRPHPFTAHQAQQIASRQGKDVYALLLMGGQAVAYGMLRGWDEGFATPSLGIAVRTSEQRKGYGRALMAWLHDEARRRGASRIRLRVHPENVHARRLYERLGYRYQGVERGELLMIIDLTSHQELSAPAQ